MSHVFCPKHLSSLSFNTQIKVNDIYVEGIKNIDTTDFNYAKELGYTIKLLAIVENYNNGILARVHPTMINITTPLAKISGALNAIEIKADMLGEIIIQGPGAGASPTTAAILNDLISLIKNEAILLRNPNFSRPWQLVLEPIKGYLILAKKQFENPLKFSGAWNFGTEPSSVTNVKQIVKYMIEFWGQGKMRALKNVKFYEQQNLQLDITKAKSKLNWFPTYNIENSIKITTEWYIKVLRQGKSAHDVTNQQLESYMNENSWT